MAFMLGARFPAKVMCPYRYGLETHTEILMCVPSLVLEMIVKSSSMCACLSHYAHGVMEKTRGKHTLMWQVCFKTDQLTIETCRECSSFVAMTFPDEVTNKTMHQKSKDQSSQHRKHTEDMMCFPGCFE